MLSRVRTALVIVSALCAPVARADIFVSLGSGAWNSASTWLRLSGSSHAHPHAGDTATVSVTHRITLTQDEQCSFLTVNGGTLILPGGRVDVGAHMLTIAGAGGLTIRAGVLGPPGVIEVGGPGGTLRLSGGGTSSINGLVELQAAASRILITTSSSTLAGVGRILGQDNTARIEISGALTLTSEVTVEGALEIRAGSGTFTNDGAVNARHAFSDDNRLTLYSGAFNGGGTYKVSAEGATLRARLGIDGSGMAADFVVQAGTLDVDDNVCTTGSLTFTGGTIDVAGGKSFRAGQ